MRNASKHLFPTTLLRDLDLPELLASLAPWGSWADLSTQPVHSTWRGLQDPINKLERCDLNATRFKSSVPCHPPARTDKGGFVSLSTCLALHVPRCFVALCTHLFHGLPFSLYLPQPLSPSLPHPVSHCWFAFLLWDLGSHSESTLFSSYPFQRMGPERQNGWLWFPPPPPPPSQPHQPTLLFLPCDDVMAFICSGGTRRFSLGVTHSISPTSSPQPSLTFIPVFLSQSISQILWPLQARLEDLRMFGCCFAHPWHMFGTQEGDNHPLQLRLPF